ncbi:DEAD/DEAH box helicase [[Clostridium] polysaccharolyticum]|uniref:Superfamily II DNA or RNA helicase, SNF2 family n=1 Tax=[Clostridium] polysaccharolyticum TaxID=29364 RepID=A0A1I0AU43_9FIRM|nr:DEAD/DEAH box helicase [[Clostridium] polysaccharolyticum]SES97460.1 Superfamily II DNA or RNA helicase, SNF2 family [[Clostridium] polysaccharolyticum]
MFKISKDSIKRLATDEATYFRGLRYYKSNAVSNVTWSKARQQYRATVKGSNQYIVTIEEDKNSKQLKFNCNCPAHIKYDGACKHVIAALLFITNYMERSETRKPENEEEKSLYQIVEYFNNQYKTPALGETFHIEVKLHFPSILKGKDSKLFLSLRAGSSRFYKVQNVKKFLHAYSNGENIALGKEFRFVAGESRFSKSSQPVMTYLQEIYEIQEALGKVYYNNLFNKAEMAITKNMLFHLLGYMGKEEFQIELGDDLYEGVTFVKGNPPIGFQLESHEESIQIELMDKTPVKPLSEDGSLLLHDNVLYMPSKEFIANYLPFFNCMNKNKERLVFQGELKDRFIDSVLPRIHETMEINVLESLKDNYINEDLKIRIYLDKYRNYVKALLKFQYGDYEINPLINDLPAGIILVRQKEAEEECLDLLDNLHFEPYKDFFLLKKDGDIYEFLSHDIYMLNEKYEVYHSEDLKKIRISSNSPIHTAIHFNGDVKLLEMNVSYDVVPKEELKAFFEALKQKKKYHRLKDGSFVNLDGEDVNQIAQLLERLDVEEHNIDESGGINLPAYQALYLDKIMDDFKGIEYERSLAYENLLEEIMTPKQAHIQVPETVQAKLRPYQAVGYKWMYSLSQNRLGGILADDMGLGKTLQAITYIAACLEQDKDAVFLVVSPTSLVYNWQEEFEKFAPQVTAVIVEGTPEERMEQIARAKENHVMITSYPLIRRDIEHYVKHKFHTMFIDEAQFIKNPSSQNAKSVKQVVAKQKFALTGTPIENSLSELWSLFDFILPDYLYSHSKFVERFEKPIVKEGSKEVLEDLGKHIEPFILRRMKKEVLTELPDKIESKMMAEMTEEQEKVYQAYLQNIRQELTAEIKEKGFEKSKMQILAALTRLRQICCHPSTFIDNYYGESGKLKLLSQILNDILENGHRVLIFSQFTSMLEIIAEELKKQEIEYFYLSGNTKIQDRKDYVARFNDGEGSVFLISLKAGGTGLNLVGADVVIHYDPWWNPAVEEQAADRVYRIGQKKSVQVIRLLTKNTIEEKIDKLQKRKKELSDSVIKSKEVFINQLSREELEELFL